MRYTDGAIRIHGNYAQDVIEAWLPIQKCCLGTQCLSNRHTVCSLAAATCGRLRSCNDKVGRFLFFFDTDETWFNAGHASSEVWVDETVDCGLSTGLQNHSCKGGRVIVTHNLFSKRSVPGKENSVSLRDEFLPLLLPESIIATDKAYHSVKHDTLPRMSKSQNRDRLSTKWQGHVGLGP